jgi:Gene product 88
MTALLVKNSKIAASANDLYTLYNFGIPAYKAADGTVTCPMADRCAEGCYARSGAYVWSNVAQAYEYRLKAALSGNFVELLEKELAPKVKTAKRQGKQLVIRIHDSGDFFGLKYLQLWIKIMERNKDVLFYAYTKMVPLVGRLLRQGKLPSNFIAIFSEGGIADGMIDRTKDRHSRVFTSEEALITAGYDNASKDDTVAFTSKTGKIGLIYHGFSSKAWNTEQ